MEVTEQRATSYWNDDYRGQIRREEYPQLAALRALAALEPVQQPTAAPAASGLHEARH